MALGFLLMKVWALPELLKLDRVNLKQENNWMEFIGRQIEHMTLATTKSIKSPTKNLFFSCLTII